MPVGQITAKQMLRIAEIADLYGSGEIRLTVWQNFIIPNVPDAYVETVKKALRKTGFDTRQSLLRGGLIACTGNSYCKHAQTNTKGQALELADYLEKRLALDVPINIHLTGCPNSCAQHYMGDIGLLGTKVRGEEGYHVFCGRRLWLRQSGRGPANFFRGHGQRLETDAGEDAERLFAPARERRAVPEIHRAARFEHARRAGHFHQ